MTAPNELSFLPDDYLARKARRRMAALGGALLSIVVFGVGGALYVTERSTRDLEVHHTEVVRAYNDAARRIEQVKKLHEEQRKIVQHAELAASLVEKVPRSNILAELTNTLPKGASLLDLSLESKAKQEPAPATAFDAKKAALEAKGKMEANGGLPDVPKFDVSLKISGLADTDVQVAQYLNQLTASPLFADVNLLISDVYVVPGDKGATMRRFQIQMMINPTAEVKTAPRLTHTAAVEMDK